MPPFPRDSELRSEVIGAFREGRPGSRETLLVAVLDLFRRYVRDREHLDEAFGAFVPFVLRGAAIVHPVRVLSRILVLLEAARFRSRDSLARSRDVLIERYRELQARAGDGETEAMASELRTAVSQAVDRLPVHERFVINGWLSDLTYSEIAAGLESVFHVSCDAARARRLAFQARVRLRRDLAAFEPGGPAGRRAGGPAGRRAGE
jgi:hypothetical protein